ncbi:hypothetical protein H4219_005098 [Mycoemilia scoparia]|uniref:Uncharacterized protein n=1 Tax=Mycoemilia scoparia TaxID=417184 RepID=A0A9W7ZVX9_9FUNG|nr:hypothetical protein H4219_005098 [Mycoemilia scoparia]
MDFSASAITTTTTTSSPPQTNAVHLPGYYTLLRSVGMHEIPEIMIEPSRNPPYSRGENGNNLRPISSIQLAVVQPSFIPLHGFLPPPQLLQSQNQQDRLIVGVRKSSNTAFVPSNQPTTDAVGESGNTGPGTVISTAEGLDFLFIHPDDLRSALSSTITSEQAMYDGGIVNVSETSGFY